MSHVELNQAGLDDLFANPAGPVAAIIRSKTVLVNVTAKSLMRIPGGGEGYYKGEVWYTKDGSAHRFFPSNEARQGRPSAREEMEAEGRVRSADHRASAPGAPASTDPSHPPASQANLAASFHTDYVIGPNPRATEATFNGQVGSGVYYFLWVELGTSKMDPRPTLRPALHIAVG